MSRLACKDMLAGDATARTSTAGSRKRMAIATRSLRSKSALTMTGIRSVGGSPVRTAGEPSAEVEQPATKAATRHATSPTGSRRLIVRASRHVRIVVHRRRVGQQALALEPDAPPRTAP